MSYQASYAIKSERVEETASLSFIGNLYVCFTHLSSLIKIGG
jgi:hypothetical protein